MPQRADDRAHGHAVLEHSLAVEPTHGSHVFVVAPGSMVLLVEDDDSMRESIRRLLDAAEFGCTAYASAEALLARQIDEDAVCVISDLRLPGMSGLGLLAALRVRDLHMPLVLITAHDTPGLRETAMRCGAAAVLAKPFRGTTLLQAVHAAIEFARPS